MKVLWFSRHDMTDAQREMFQWCQVTKVDGSPANVHVPFEATVDNAAEKTQLPAMKDYIQEFDVLAIVAPIGLQQQFLQIAGGRPVVYAKTRREVLEGGEKVVFNFDGWERLIKIEVATEKFTLCEA